MLKALKVLGWIAVGLVVVFCVTIWSLTFIGALSGPAGG